MPYNFIQKKETKNFWEHADLFLTIFLMNIFLADNA